MQKITTISKKNCVFFDISNTGNTWESTGLEISHDPMPCDNTLDLQFNLRRKHRHSNSSPVPGMPATPANRKIASPSQSYSGSRIAGSAASLSNEGLCLKKSSAGFWSPLTMAQTGLWTQIIYIQFGYNPEESFTNKENFYQYNTGSPTEQAPANINFMN